MQVDSGPSALIYIARNNGAGQSFTLMPPVDPTGIPFGIGGGDVDLVSAAAFGLELYGGNGSTGRNH